MSIVETPSGRVRGIETQAGPAFLGIRFAKPPTGALRFRPPVTVTAWSDVYDATRFGAAPPQHT